MRGESVSTIERPLFFVAARCAWVGDWGRAKVCRSQVLILCQRLYYTCGFVCVCVCVCEVDRQGQRLQGVSSKACDSVTCSAVVSKACGVGQRGRHVT